MSDAELAAWRRFSAAVRFSPAACSGPVPQTRYCCRQDEDGAGAGEPAPDPADVTAPPPDAHAVDASPAASMAPAKMTLHGIGGRLPQVLAINPACGGAERCTANSPRARPPASQPLCNPAPSSHQLWPVPGI